MLRGELVIVSGQDDYGKPRPAVIVQNSRLLDQIDSITVCFLTPQVGPAKNLRATVEPSAANNLRGLSQIQIEKVMTFPRSKVHGPIRWSSAEHMQDADRYLMLFFDLLPPIASAPSN